MQDMKPKKTSKAFWLCALLGIVLCSCRSHYYLPGGNYRRRPAKDCGCPSFAKNHGLFPGISTDKTINGNQPMYAKMLPVAEMPHDNERR